MSRFHRNKYKKDNLTPITNVAVAKVNDASLIRLRQIIDILL